MPNSIKYNTIAETLALKKGDFWIGTGDVGKGSTASTGFYSGTAPASGGYTIYLNKSGGPAIYLAANDSQLITLTNIIAGASYNNANDCFNWFAGQNDKFVANRDYEPIITNGLILNIDAGYTASYPKNGTTWYDISNNVKNSTLISGPSYNTAGGGSILYDGSDDYTEGVVPSTSNTNVTITGFAEITLGTGGCIVKFGQGCAGYSLGIGNNYFTSPGNEIVGLFSCIRWIPSGANWNSGWNGFGMSIDGNGTARFYKNGVLVSTSSGGAPAAVSGFYYTGRCIGDEGSPSERAFEGKLSSVQLYNRVLSDSEVLANFNAMKGRFGL